MQSGTILIRRPRRRLNNFVRACHATTTMSNGIRRITKYDDVQYGNAVVYGVSRVVGDMDVTGGQQISGNLSIAGGQDVVGNLVTGNLRVTGATTTVTQTTLLVTDPKLSVGTGSRAAMLSARHTGLFMEHPFGNSAVVWNSSALEFQMFTTTLPMANDLYSDATYARLRVGNLVSGALSVSNAAITDLRYAARANIDVIVNGANLAGNVATFANVTATLLRAGNLLANSLTANALTLAPNAVVRFGASTAAPVTTTGYAECSYSATPNTPALITSTGIVTMQSSVVTSNRLTYDIVGAKTAGPFALRFDYQYVARSTARGMWCALFYPGTSVGSALDGSRTVGYHFAITSLASGQHTLSFLYNPDGVGLASVVALDAASLYLPGSAWLTFTLEFNGVDRWTWAVYNGATVLVRRAFTDPNALARVTSGLVRESVSFNTLAATGAPTQYLRAFSFTAGTFSDASAQGSAWDLRGMDGRSVLTADGLTGNVGLNASAPRALLEVNGDCILGGDVVFGARDSKVVTSDFSSVLAYGTAENTRATVALTGNILMTRTGLTSQVQSVTYDVPTLVPGVPFTVSYDLNLSGTPDGTYISLFAVTPSDITPFYAPSAPATTFNSLAEGYRFGYVRGTATVMLQYYSTVAVTIASVAGITLTTGQWHTFSLTYEPPSTFRYAVTNVSTGVVLTSGSVVDASAVDRMAASNYMTQARLRASSSATGSGQQLVRNVSLDVFSSATKGLVGAFANGGTTWHLRSQGQSLMSTDSTAPARGLTIPFANIANIDAGAGSLRVRAATGNIRFTDTAVFDSLVSRHASAIDRFGLGTYSDFGTRVFAGTASTSKVEKVGLGFATSDTTFLDALTVTRDPNSTTAGFVGINTSAPTMSLHVNGNLQANSAFCEQLVANVCRPRLLLATRSVDQLVSGGNTVVQYSSVSTGWPYVVDDAPSGFSSNVAAVRLTGAGEHLTVPACVFNVPTTTNVFRTDLSYTVETYVKLRSLHSDYRTSGVNVMGFCSASNAVGPFIAVITSTGQPRLSCCFSTSTVTQATITGPDVAATNTWHHLALTNSYTGGSAVVNGVTYPTATFYLYLNGRFQAKLDYTGLHSLNGGGSMPFNFGVSRASGGTVTMNGDVTGARVVLGTALYTSESTTAAYIPPTLPMLRNSGDFVMDVRPAPDAELQAQSVSVGEVKVSNISSSEMGEAAGTVSLRGTFRPQVTYGNLVAADFLAGKRRFVDPVFNTGTLTSTTAGSVAVVDTFPGAQAGVPSVRFGYPGYLETPGLANWDYLSQSWTMESYVNPVVPNPVMGATITSSTTRILSLGFSTAEAASASANPGVDKTTPTLGRPFLGFSYVGGAGTVTSTLTTGSYVRANTWYHLAATNEYTGLTGTGPTYHTGTLRLYLNGVIQAQQSYVGNSFGVSAGLNLFRIGATYNPNVEKFVGDLCGTRVVQFQRVYTADFTPPTLPLAVSTGNVVLTANLVGADVHAPTLAAGNLMVANVGGLLGANVVFASNVNFAGNVVAPSLLVGNLASSSTTGNVFAAGNWYFGDQLVANMCRPRTLVATRNVDQVVFGGNTTVQFANTAASGAVPYVVDEAPPGILSNVACVRMTGLGEHLVVPALQYSHANPTAGFAYDKISYTVETYVRYRSSTGAGYMIGVVGGSAIDTYFGIGAGFSSTGQPRLSAFFNGLNGLATMANFTSRQGVGVTGSDVAVSNVWHHLAYTNTYTGTALVGGPTGNVFHTGTIRLYCNGRFQGKTSYVGNAFPTGSTVVYPFQIGRESRTLSMDGDVAGTRVVLGSALYTSESTTAAYTPPTLPMLRNSGDFVMDARPAPDAELQARSMSVGEVKVSNISSSEMGEAAGTVSLRGTFRPQVTYGNLVAADFLAGKRRFVDPVFNTGTLTSTTAGSVAVVDTFPGAQAGVPSVRFGYPGYLETPGLANWDYLSQSWTMESYVNPVVPNPVMGATITSSTTRVLSLGFIPETNFGVGVGSTIGNALTLGRPFLGFSYVGGAGTVTSILATGSYVRANTWCHLAATNEYTGLTGTGPTYHTGTLRLYLNGVIQAQQSYVGNSFGVSAGLNLFRIGATYNPNVEKFVGDLCGTRVVQFQRVYTADFTPPTLPLAVSTGNVVLTANLVGADVHAPTLAAGNLMVANVGGLLGANVVFASNVNFAGNVVAPSLLVGNLASSSTTGNVFAAGSWHFGVPVTSTPPANRQLSFQLADAGSSLVIRVRGSDGLLRQGTVALTFVV